MVGGSVPQWWLWWFVLSVSVLMVPSTTRDESDAVNVISVENMDALLRMRLGPAPDVVNASTIALDRSRRAIVPLCERPECNCTKPNGWDNISCFFKGHEIFELDHQSLPSTVVEIRLEKIGQLIVRAKTFAHTPRLHTIIFKQMNRLLIHSEAFMNINSSQLYFEIENCRDVELGDHMFRGMRGPVSATISNCQQLALGSGVFSWLTKLSINNVPSLELAEGTFAAEPAKLYRHGSATTILFNNASIDAIPNGTFSSSAREVGFTDCSIKVISKNAFNAMTISRVFLENTKLGLLEGGAISHRTLITELQLRSVDVSLIEPYVLTGAVTNFTMHNCRIAQLKGGAFNLTASRVHVTDNTFKHIRRRAFELYNWIDITIDSNTFEQLDPDAFYLPFQTVAEVNTYDFTFADNRLHNVSVADLAFIPDDPRIDVRLWGNQFSAPCSCRLKSWTSELVSKNSPVIAKKLFETSYCGITDFLAVCYQLSAGYMPMLNYTDQICGPGTEIKCKGSMNRRFDYQDSSLDWGLFLDREKKVFTFIILTVLCCVCFILIVTGAMWVKRKGLIGRLISQFFQTSSLVTAASISRINVHEYAEIQNFRNQTQVVEESDEEELVLIDDKATQTLPEELTQDLLQSLREKLDDPDNYREARDMIEHLYDLIKVEESCNNRNSTVIEEGNLYAELRPRTRPRARNRDMADMGTRSPSLDKLAPVHYVPRPAVVNDYAEPRDRQVNTHVYCELPGAIPDVLVTSNLLANRPLPEAPGGSQV